MNPLKAFAWLIVLAVLVSGVVAPVVYLYVNDTLPALDTELDLDMLLKHSIESERTAHQVKEYFKNEEFVPFTRPDFSRLPKNFAALYITQRGCPTFFQTPREEGFTWVKRMVLGLIGVEPESDGWCERVLANNLARRIGAKDKLQEAVAAHKIHRFLKKDGLVAYELASIRLEPGVLGVEAAAQRLFKRPLIQLNLAELAELTLAIPPHGYWVQLRDCESPLIIKQNRDYIIEELRGLSLIPEDAARAAIREPLFCTK